MLIFLRTLIYLKQHTTIIISNSCPHSHLLSPLVNWVGKHWETNCLRIENVENVTIYMAYYSVDVQLACLCLLVYTMYTITAQSPQCTAQIFKLKIYVYLYGIVGYNW